MLNSEQNLICKNLKIPQCKVAIENQRHKTFLGFPFFLRKKSDGIIEAITMNEYPKALHLVAKYPYRRKADQANEITLSPNIVEDLLKQGYIWFHESELDTMW